MTDSPREVVFDLEGASADQLYKGGHEGPFVRLLGTRSQFFESVDSGDGKAAAVDEIQGADVKIGHNILAFDIPALARHEGGDYAKLSDGAVDTIILARMLRQDSSGRSGVPRLPAR